MLRRAAIATASSALMATGLLVAPAEAAPAAATPAAQELRIEDAPRLVGELGTDRTGGAYLDRATGKVVVNVTDKAAGQEVADAGGVARLVEHSSAELEDATSALNVSVDIPGTTWGTDANTNQVVVQADSTVSAADYAELREKATELGSAVRVQRMEGRIAKTISGGNYIRSDDGLQCSVGFNVRDKSNNDSLFFLTAGHCTVGATGVSDWRDGNGTYVGYDAGGFYPGNDFGLVRHYNANISKPGNVYEHDGTYQNITHSRDPGDGESICRSGYRTGKKCGTVLDLNVTVNYGDGNVTGLFSSTACSLPGDSGGPVYHGDAALGLHSGYNESGPCRGYHQKVNEALAWYGMEVY
jgi:hypothetical protein